MELIEFLEFFYTLIFVWLACVTALIVYNKSLAIHYRWFLLFIVAMGIAETIGNYLAFRDIRNHFYFNVYYIIQFFIVPFFYFQCSENLFLKKVIRIYWIILPVFILVDIFWLQSFNNLQTFTFVLGSSFILLLAVYYLWLMYVSDDTMSIWYDPVFWISIAYLFYYTIAIPYIGMLNYLWVNHPDFTKKYYLVYNIAIILHNVFLIAGFLCMRLTRAKR